LRGVILALRHRPYAAAKPVRRKVAMKLPSPRGPMSEALIAAPYHGPHALDVPGARLNGSIERGGRLSRMKMSVSRRATLSA
jgi:hypothetical protein